MRRLRAHVVKGQVVLDEPADLPEGAALAVVVVEENDTLDDLTPDDRTRLEAVLDAGIADVRAGRVTEGDDIVRRLLARSADDTEHTSPVTDAMNAALAQLTPDEIEADLRVVRAAARATMKPNPR